MIGRSGGMTLQRLVIDYRSGEMVLRCLYRSQDGPNPGTKARTRGVADLARTGLEQALETLEGRVDIVGTSGFTTREDIVLCTTKGGATLDEHETASSRHFGEWRGEGSLLVAPGFSDGSPLLLVLWGRIRMQPH